MHENVSAAEQATPIFDALFQEVTEECQGFILDCFDLSADRTLEEVPA
jgi:hypothetical protein